MHEGARSFANQEVACSLITLSQPWCQFVGMRRRKATASSYATRDEMRSTSTWFALRNPVFCRLWLASLLSGTFVSAQDMTATWLMHDLGASSLSLSLMATAASAPFFLFTLPAGAIADIVNRRVVIVSAVLWQGACVSAPCSWGMDTT